MSRFRPYFDNHTIEDPAADFRSARKLEQYRLGEKALYMPCGFKWDYIPLSCIESAEESHRCISSGKCVSVTEKRPSVDINTTAGQLKLNFEKTAGAAVLLSAYKK